MIVKTLEHNGHKIELWHDDTGYDLNPFSEYTDFSAAVYNSSGLHVHNGFELVAPALTDDQLWLNSDLILQAINDPDFTKEVCKDGVADPVLLSNGIDDYLAYGASHREIINMLYVLYTAADIPCTMHNGTGYAQGDWHTILVVIDKDVAKEYPAPINECVSMAQDYELWVYGDAYGYRIVKPTTCKCCNHTAFSEVDSCWGFLCRQDDDVWNEMIEMAKGHC